MLKNESTQNSLSGTPGKFPLPNLQVLVMLGAIVLIALFFTWTTDGDGSAHVTYLTCCARPRLPASWRSGWCL